MAAAPPCWPSWPTSLVRISVRATCLPPFVDVLRSWPLVVTTASILPTHNSRNHLTTQSNHSVREAPIHIRSSGGSSAFEDRRRARGLPEPRDGTRPPPA